MGERAVRTWHMTLARSVVLSESSTFVLLVLFFARRVASIPLFTHRLVLTTTHLFFFSDSVMNVGLNNQFVTRTLSMDAV
jgi:hypothetical protein